jgi:hypothetical protein
MKRPTKSDDGLYHIRGSKYPMLIGTRAQVWHGTAYKTSGGLTKNDLVQNKAGRIVSRAKHATAKKEMRLVKHGYGTKKGKFGYVKLRKHSKKMKGGADLSPADVDAPYMMRELHTMNGGYMDLNDPQQHTLMAGGRRSRRRNIRMALGRSRSARRSLALAGGQLGAPIGAQ